MSTGKKLSILTMSLLGLLVLPGVPGEPARVTVPDGASAEFVLRSYFAAIIYQDEAGARSLVAPGLATELEFGRRDSGYHSWYAMTDLKIGPPRSAVDCQKGGTCLSFAVSFELPYFLGMESNWGDRVGTRFVMIKKGGRWLVDGYGEG